MSPVSRRNVIIIFVLAVMLTVTLAWPLQAAVFQSTLPTPTPTSPAPTATPVVPPTTCTGFFYRVNFGDTLYRIALRFGTTIRAIAACNNIINTNLIVAGRYLLIPTGVVPPAPTTCTIVYVVRWGDTVYRIALRYGTTVTAVAALNHLVNPNRIWPGQRLLIPIRCG